MTPNLTDSDEGKRVVSNDGEEVGRVVEVKEETAFVDPNANLEETLKSKIGLTDEEEGSFTIDASSISEITGDEVRIRSK